MVGFSKGHTSGALSVVATRYRFGKMHYVENAMGKDEIIATFMSQENIGLAADH